MAAPPEKKQKTLEEAPEASDKVAVAGVWETLPKPPEPPKELEEDAPAIKGAKVEKAVEFLLPDTTVNVMSSTAGNLMMSMQDNGLQHLLAGARANTGIKAGRYTFEVKIVECCSPSDTSGPYPRNLLRIGFSTAGSSLLLEPSDTSVSFDSEGYFSGVAKGKVSQKLTAGSVVACLLNLEKEHANYNTISLFRDGIRICQPQAIPTSLHGKTLFPTVGFRCMTVHTNFGPEPMVPLPFKCHMVGGAAKDHTEVKTYIAPKEFTVVFPVSLPDEGSFDWVDEFTERNPHYMEISDRKIRDWAEKSAHWSKRGTVTASSNDKPEMSFGVPKLDDGYSVKKMLKSVAVMQKRNYVVMELKGNLIKEERALILDAFRGKGFKTQAAVLVGDPPVAFAKRSRELLLKQKQEASDKTFREQREAEKRKRLQLKRQKEQERARKKATKDKEKAAKAKAKAAEEAKNKVSLDKAGEAEKDEKAEGEKEEQDAQKKEDPQKEEEEDPEDEEEEPEEPEPPEEDPPKVTLSDDEKKLKFRPPLIPDLTQYVLNTNFTRFSIPQDGEGFDEIKYEFIKDAAKAKKYVDEWISAKKLVTRVEDIKPSDWFWGVKKTWDKALHDWHTALSQYKVELSKKHADRVAKDAKQKQAAAKAAAAKAKAEAAKAKAEKDGADPPPEPEDPAKDEAEEEEEDEPEAEISFDEIDVFGVSDVKDVGGGMPLFKEFTPDDWTLLGLAFELHLLGHAFRRDCNDADRAGMHIDHVDFYYSKYFKKALVPKSFGVETVREVVALVRDVVYVNSKGVLQNSLHGEMETYQVFIKIVEEARRFRKVRIDSGDDAAALKFAAHFKQGGNQHHHQHHHHQQHHHGQKRKQNWTPIGSSGKADWQQWGPPAKRSGGSKGWSKK